MKLSSIQESIDDWRLQKHLGVSYDEGKLGICEVFDEVLDTFKLSILGLHLMKKKGLLSHKPATSQSLFPNAHGLYSVAWIGQLDRTLTSTFTAADDLY